MVERRAREDWEVEQAQEQAMLLHHNHMDQPVNRYKTTQPWCSLVSDLDPFRYTDGPWHCDRAPVKFRWLL